jgi:5'-nucleotidase (lipoprotein e(P4) family)
MRFNLRPLTALLLVASAAACSSLSTTTAAPAGGDPGAAAPAATKAPRVTHEELQAVLWMQTSAEYWASATAVYAAARRGIDAGLKDRKWTAALEQQGEFRRLPPAIILDIDETVLDNSRFQGRMIEDDKFYDPAVWDLWVAGHRATSVPGAVDFLRYAEERKVAVFLVSNRTLAQEAATIENLRILQIHATPEMLLSKDENGWTSDKSPRRAFVAANYRVLALVGDDLNDFVSANDKTLKERAALAAANAAFWGSRWFLLPNAMYGSWDRSLYPGIADEDAQLAKKRTLVDSF